MSLKMNMKEFGLACVVATSWLLSRGEVTAQLPENFPGIAITTYDSNKVSPGYIFLASWRQTPGSGTYLMILNNDGTPVEGDKYQELLETAGDFKVQPNGLLSYAQTFSPLSYTGGWDVEHKVVDESLTNVIESVQMRNGYLAEFHDFQLLPNGHALVLGYYLSEVNLSPLVSSGNPGALVSGAIIQELDAQRNAVFQWRSWDHYDYADVSYGNPTASKISQFHINNLNLDVDGNLIAGTPAEIRKISRQTGEVLWTLGGPDNEFTVAGAGAVSDFGGHGTHRLANGNFLMYDNGNAAITSRVHEYALDETNKIATRVWSYSPDIHIAGQATGYAQRLPNGNTLICWGIPRNATVPICTEVTPTGEKVFELTFTNSAIQSYRAYRFRYPSANEKLKFTQLELAGGNSYHFTNTGVSITVNTGGGGYNEVSVTREPYAPFSPLFQGKAPRVLTVRVSLTESFIGSMNARVEFDAVNFGFTNPTNLVVYHRTRTGEGLFLPKTTDYNSVTRKLRVTMALTSQAGQFGEFVFGYPDVADVPFPPMLAEVENYRGIQTQEIIAPKLAAAGAVHAVNQELPILLSWSPKGFARWYEFQIATSQDFANPVVSVAYQTDAFTVWSNASPNWTYFYRAKTWNEGGESDWAVGSFRTVAPMIVVSAPNGGEAWQRGLSYFVHWNANTADDVVIDLYKGGEFLRTLATNSLTHVFRWEIDMDLVPGNDYSIKISSVSDMGLADLSDLPFNIDVPRITSIHQDQNGALVLEWAGSSGGVYVEFNPTLAAEQWQAIGGPFSGSAWTNAPQATTEGFYRLRLE